MDSSSGSRSSSRDKKSKDNDLHEAKGSPLLLPLPGFALPLLFASSKV